MTLPSEYNAISMGQVRTELNKSSGPISLNDDDVRILFQVSRTSGTIISMHNGHGKSNIMPPVVTKPPLLVDPLTNITQTSVTVTWKAYQSLVVDGQVDHYQVQVYSVPDNVKRWDSNDLAQSASTVNVTGLVASSNHLVTNYRVDVMAKNVSATKTSSLNLLTLENVPLLPSKPVATVISSTQLSINSTSTYATTFYIYKDGSSTPITTSSMPYTDTVGVYTSHTYTVKGHSTGGDGPISVSSDSVRSLPDAPLAVVFTAYSSTNTTLTINWTLSTSPVVNYYKLVVVNFGTTTEVYRNDNVSYAINSVTINTGLSATSKYTATVETVNESSIFYNIPVSISEDVWTKTNAVASAPTVTKLTDATLGQKQLQVVWGSVTGATGYKLVRTKVINSVAQTPVTFTVTPTVNGATLTFTDGDTNTSPSELSSYSYYRYNVIAVNAGGDSALSPVSSDVRTLPGPPVAVTNLQVILTNIAATTATATWTDDTGQVNSYTAILKQGATTIDTKTNIAPGTQTVTFGSPTALTQDTSYSVTVTTYNDNTPPATTAPVSFRTKLTKPSSAPSIARNPDSLLGRSHITVSWTAISGASSYNLIRTRVSDSVEYSINTVSYSGTTDLSYDDSGLNSYEQYKYQLVAVNDGGGSVRSDYSNTERTFPGPALAVTGVQFGTITTTTAAVSWTAAIGQVTSYVVIVSDTNGEVYRFDNGNVVSATIGQSPNALTANRAYSVVIKTVNENTDTSTAFTTSKGFVTITSKPNAPSVATATSTSELVVSWTTNSATTYDITRYNVTSGAAGVVFTNKTTPFTDTGLSAYNEYQYTVTSNNGASTPVGVTSDKSPTGVRTLPNNPVAVSAITAVVKSGTLGASSMTVTVGWTNTNWAPQYGVVTKYDVIMTPNGSATDYGTTGISSSSTSQDLPSVPTGTLFNVTVKTYNAVGNASSTVQFTSPPAKPGTPYLDTGVTPNPTQTRISLKWTAVGGVLSSYTLTPYRSSDNVQLTEVTNIGSNIVDYTSTAGSSYYFKVTAVNVGGSSLASTSFTAASLANVPTNVSASTVANSTNLTVTWDSMTGATSYNVFRTEVVGGVDQTEVALGAKERGFTDTLSGEKTYYYKVTSLTTNGGESAKSTKSNNVTTLPSVPGTPSGVTITLAATTSFTASWTAPTSGGTVASYKVRVRANGASTDAFTAAPTSTSVSVNTGLAANTRYNVYVLASNAGGDSATEATSPAITLPPKVSIGVSSAISSGMRVNWSAPAGLTLSYSVYRVGTTNPLTTAASGTYYDDTTTAAETSYQYYVKANNTTTINSVTYGGLGESSDTSVAKYTFPAAPAVPTISFVPGVGTKVTLLISSANATSYTYSYGTSLPTSASNADADGSVVIADGTLSYGLTYYFVATATRSAYNLDATSALSTGYTYETPPAKPAAPTLSYGAKQITLSWTANTNYSYEVYRQNVGAGSSALLTATKLTFGSTSGTYTDSSTFADSTTYSYQIKVYNASDKSAISDASTSFKTPAALGTVSFTNNYVGFKTFNATISCTNASTFYVGAMNNTQTLPSSIPYSSYASLTFNHSTDVNGNSLDYTYRYSVSVHAANYLLELPPSVIVTIPWNTAMSTTAQVTLLPGTVDLYNKSANVPYDATKITVVACGGGGGGGGFEAAPNGTDGGKGGDARVITATFNLTSSIAIIFATVGNGGAPGSGNATSGTAAPAGGTGYAAGGVGGKAGSSGRSGQGGGGGGSTHVYGATSSNVMLTSYVVAGGGGGGGGGSAYQAGYAGGPGLFPSTTLSTTVGEAGTNAGAVNGGGGGGGGGSGGTKGAAGKDGIAGTRAFGGEGGSVAYSTANLVGTPSYSAGNNGGTAGISATSSLGGNGGLGKAIITFS